MRTRVALLSSPVFLAAVALLAVNDHLLKEHYPGVVSGKLSDFAGVFVVAALVGVVSGRRFLATILTAIGFVALKTIPFVAVAAAPVLGGRTLADPSDLVALIVLVPAWYWLGHQMPSPRGETRQALGVIGACAAMLTLTATSCATPVQVEHLVRAPDGSLWAATGQAGWTEEWATSRDGRTWTETRTKPRPPYGTPRTTCLDDGSCFRVIPGDRVESRAGPGSPWRTEYRYTDEQVRRRDHRIMRCAREVPAFASVVVAGSNADEHVVVNMGPDAVLWRSADGSWQRRAVLDVEPVRLDGPSWLAGLGIVPLGALALLAVALVLARVIRGHWYVWIEVAMVGMLGVTMVAGALGLAGLDYTVWGPLAVVLTVFVLVASPLVARYGPWPRPRTLQPARGWYPNPEQADQLRWWDGWHWAESRQPKDSPN